MATNIGPKIGIEGEAEYRKQIQNIVQQMKTLDSEMKLVAATYDKSDAAQDRAAASSDILRKEIAKQEEAISAIRTMLEKSREKYGENADETLKWQQAMNGAETSLAKMSNQLNEFSAQAQNNGLDEMAHDADKLGDELEDGGKHALSFGEAIKANVIASAIIDGLKQLASGLGDAVKAMAQLSVDAAAFADEILTESTVTGIATDKLQEYQYAAELVDVSTETLTKSMARNIKSMKSAQDGTASSVEAYAALGVAVTNADGSLRDSEAVYWEIIDALGGLDNETERDAISMQILGKSAQELNPLIEAGAERMQELGAQAREAGYVMSGDTLNAFGAFDDQLQYLNVGATAAKNALGAILLPTLTELATNGVSLLGTFTNGILNANGDIGLIGETITQTGEMLNGFAQNFVAQLPDLSAIFSTAFVGISEFLPDLFSTLLLGVLDEAPRFIDAGLQIITNLADGIGQNAPTLITATTEAVFESADALLDNVDAFIDAGIDLITGLADGLIEALPVIAEKTPEIIKKIVEVLLDNNLKLVEAAIDLTIAIGTGMIEALPELIGMLPEIIKGIIDAFKKVDWGEIGKNIMEGIKEGLKNMLETLIKSVKDIAHNILQAAKDVLGIHSPSRVFADTIGENIPLGILQGVEAAMPKTIRGLQREFDSLTDVPIAVQPSVGGYGVGASLPTGTAYTTNMGGVTVQVYAASGQDVNQIADAVVNKINKSVARQGAVFA